MKLANALSQRGELQTRIRQLESRLYNNAQVQESEFTAEDYHNRTLICAGGFGVFI